MADGPVHDDGRVAAVVVLLELLFGEKSTHDFTTDGARIVGLDEEFIQRVRISKAEA